MVYRFRKGATFGIRLIKEAWTHPQWAICHLYGMLDYQMLSYFHKKKVHRWIDNCERKCAKVTEILGRKYRESAEEICKEYEKAKTEWNEEVLSQAIPPRRDASRELQFLLFSLVLLVKPERVLEIGVARGASSRALLSGLERIGMGNLVSIDFPFLTPNYAKEIGALVPAALRNRWRVHIGPSQLVLPKILRTGEKFQLIVHDGAHSYYVQRGDLRRSLNALEAGGVLVCDDLNNDSFLEVCENQFETVCYLRQSAKEEPIGLAWQRHSRLG